MEQIEQILFQIKVWAWGPPLLFLTLGIGLYLSFSLSGVQFRYLGYAFRQAFTPQSSHHEGDIKPFEALMTSLASAIGTGNIVGVTTALTIGGMGSLFWMWVTALISLAIKYSESVLAIRYRRTDKKGEMCGGPMQYIETGLGWKKTAYAYAFLASLAALGTGNLVQVNAISESITCYFPVNPWLVGIALAVITGLVLIGGVKSIGKVAGILVPIMGLFYLFGGTLILVLNAAKLPAALLLIIKSAFTPQAAVGGFAGASVFMAIQMGVSRSVFSNEAGLGLSSIAAAAAITDSPAKQSLINMTGALISTVLVCSITGLVVAVTETLGATGQSGQLLTGVSLAITAFETSIPGGGIVVSVGLILFAYSTVIAWAYYGEKCFEYFFGDGSVKVYRLIFVAMVIPAAALKMEIAWHLAEICNALISIPNLLALFFLSHVILEETKKFMNQQELIAA